MAQVRQPEDVGYPATKEALLCRQLTVSMDVDCTPSSGGLLPSQLSYYLKKKQKTGEIMTVFAFGSKVHGLCVEVHQS